MFDGRVKIVCRSSCRTSAIVKYFVPKWSEYVLVIWTLSPYYFPLYFCFFSTYEHSHFFSFLYKMSVLIERTTHSTVLAKFFRTLRCFVFGMKIYMWFGHYCYIICFHMFNYVTVNINICDALTTFFYLHRFRHLLFIRVMLCLYH